MYQNWQANFISRDSHFHELHNCRCIFFATNILPLLYARDETCLILFKNSDSFTSTSNPQVSITAPM